MVSTPARWAARLAWFAPALLLFLTVDQAKVAFDLRQTYATGTPATAEVLAYENTDRADIKYGYVDLRIPLADGRVLEKEKLSLPLSILPRLDGAQEVAVHVRPGAAQEVVIDRLMPAHALIAASQAGISLLGMLLSATLIFFWNRWQRRLENAEGERGSVGEGEIASHPG